MTRRSSPTVHGKNSRYQAGCRCDPCRVAHRRAQTRYRLKTLHGPASVNPVGSARRLRALAVMGWRSDDIAVATGIDAKTIRELTRAERAWIMDSTAAAIDRVFRELCMRPGPSRITAQRAYRKGWLPPLAWDCIDDPDERPATVTVLPGSDVDEVAVERAMRGDRVTLTPAERAEVVRRLSEDGETLNRIATLLHSSIPRVREIRRRHGIESSYDPQRSAS